MRRTSGVKAMHTTSLILADLDRRLGHQADRVVRGCRRLSRTCWREASNSDVVEDSFFPYCAPGGHPRPQPSEVSRQGRTRRTSGSNALCQACREWEAIHGQISFDTDARTGPWCALPVARRRATRVPCPGLIRVDYSSAHRTSYT